MENVPTTPKPCVLTEKLKKQGWTSTTREELPYYINTITGKEQWKCPGKSGIGGSRKKTHRKKRKSKTIKRRK